ncbi:hypothetical protein NLI96_g7801 [Meripilus lineatus]|uniref:Uncharacterized protein n=1 Tax=Meripilus lineatus TaxID=2056292 RepID=A0AAD5V044_9APHY|nr:hypothetical protein NLI96_g7801 [Physisporinus lineatus]
MRRPRSKAFIHYLQVRIWARVKDSWLEGPCVPIGMLFHVEPCRNVRPTWVSTAPPVFKSAGDAQKLLLTVHDPKTNITLRLSVSNELSIVSFDSQCLLVTFGHTRCLLKMIRSQESPSPSRYLLLLLVYSLLSALWSTSDDLFVPLAPFDTEEVERGLDGNVFQFLGLGAP